MYPESASKEVRLPVPYYSQLDNDIDWNTGPWNECSYTCMAMALGYLGLVGNGDGQFEDQIERSYESYGYQRGNWHQMSAWINSEYSHLGVVNEFHADWNLQNVIDSIDAGRAVILHTFLTRSGHIVVASGYDRDAYGGNGALLIHDPNGEWFHWGYDKSRSGQYVPLSFRACQEFIAPDNNYYSHQTWKI